MKDKPIILIGASGHGKVIAELIDLNGRHLSCFYDNDKNKKELAKYPVAHYLKEKVIASHDFIISIGDNKLRKGITEQNNFSYTKLFHPKAIISDFARIKEGTVAMAGSVVNPGSVIGAHVILNTNCNIDHESVLEDFVHISPGVSIAGNVSVGEGTHVGIGATVIQNVCIGKYCIIGAGAVVINDIPDHAVVVGIPAKIIRFDH